MFLFCNCKNVEQLLLFNLLFYYQRKMRRLTKSSRLHLFSYNSVLIICLVKTAGKVTSAEERGHLVLVEICLTDIISILVIICVKGAGLAVCDLYFFLFGIFLCHRFVLLLPVPFVFPEILPDFPAKTKTPSAHSCKGRITALPPLFTIPRTFRSFRQYLICS